MSDTDVELDVDSTTVQARDSTHLSLRTFILAAEPLSGRRRRGEARRAPAEIRVADKFCRCSKVGHYGSGQQSYTYTHRGDKDG